MHQVFSGNIARRILETSVRTATQASHRGVKIVHAHLQRRHDIGQTQAACVMHVQIDFLLGPLVLHQSDQPAYRIRIGPAHGIGQLNQFNLDAAIACDLHLPFDQTHHMMRVNIAFVVAAESRHHADLAGRYIEVAQGLDANFGFGQAFFDRAVGILLRESFAGGHAQAAKYIELAGRHRARHAFLIQVDAGVERARSALEAGNHLLGIGHLRHPFRADKRGGFDLGKITFRQQVNETDFFRGGDGRLFDLHAFARAEFVNSDFFWIGHGLCALR